MPKPTSLPHQSIVIACMTCACMQTHLQLHMEELAGRACIGQAGEHRLKGLRPLVVKSLGSMEDPQPSQVLSSPQQQLNLSQAGPSAPYLKPSAVGVVSIRVHPTSSGQLPEDSGSGNRSPKVSPKASGSVPAVGSMQRTWSAQEGNNARSPTMQLYMAFPPSLLPRFALLKPVRSLAQLSLGFLQAPIGIAT